MARYSSTEAALSPGRRSIAVPSVAARTISWPDRRAASMTLAATDTARSSESPAWAVRRRSSTTAVAPGAGLLVLAHDELAGPGRGAPVDVAQVVAGHVLPQAAEAVAARGLDHLAVADRGRLLLTARGRADPVDAWVDHDLDGAAHRQPAPGQAEGIRPQRLEGSDAEDAAAAGRQAVRGLALPTRPQRRQAHAGADGAGHGVAHGQDGGGHPAAVGDAPARRGRSRRRGGGPGGPSAGRRG